MKNKYKKRMRGFSGHHLKKQYKKSVRRVLMNELLLLSKRDIDDFAENLPSITRDDNLFSESENVRDVILNTTASANDVLLPNGYISSSILLLKIIRFSQSNLIKDSYIFPALFCFRQYLELIMKGIILRYRNGDMVPYEGEGPFKTHDLDELCKKLLKHVQMDEQVENICRIIHELNEIDNDSTAFRYDFHLNQIIRNKDRKKIHELLNVDVLQTRILQLYRFFDGLDDESRAYAEKNNNT